MIKFRFVVKALMLSALISLVVSAVQAQSRTWVSGVGNDADPCSRTAPCKTLSGAISKTGTGGEINILDPGGFGAVTITKAITIDGIGITGGMLASGISGITVNITTNLASDKVIIRNVEINGNNAAGGFHGIRFLDGAELTVENVTIQNFTGNGVLISTPAASITNLHNVSTDNISGVGVNVSPTGGEAVVTITNCRLRGTGAGVQAVNNGRVMVRDSLMTKGTWGVRTSGSNSIVHLVNDVISFCTTGLQASLGSSINVSDSTIAQNGTGVSAGNGAVNSFQGNSLINNTTPGTFTSTTAKQ
jgi:copper-binding protein NosD